MSRFKATPPCWKPLEDREQQDRARNIESFVNALYSHPRYNKRVNKEEAITQQLDSEFVRTIRAALPSDNILYGNEVVEYKPVKPIPHESSCCSIKDNKDIPPLMTGLCPDKLKEVKGNG